MKIVVYTADSEVPFNEFYKPLSSWNKIIFSNKKQIRFNEKAVKQLLPKGVVDDANIRHIPTDDNSIFFIPLEMKDMFFEHLKDLFQTTEWQNIVVQKPSKEEVGLGGGMSKLAQFYDKVIKVVEVWTPNHNKPKECFNKKLQNLLDEIVKEDNLINAVFVHYLGTSTYKSAEDDEDGKNFINGIDSISFDKLKNTYHILVNFGNIAKRGNFEYGTFRFDNGVFSLYFFNKVEQLVIIGFFSTVRNKLLLHDCEQASEQIEEVI